MKIAIAADGGQVSPHFGHCEGFMVYDVDNGKVTAKEMVQNPGHTPGFLPKFLAEKGVNTIIAGGMGATAQNLFAERNIKVVAGVAGSAETVIEQYLNDSLKSQGNSCDH